MGLHKTTYYFSVSGSLLLILVITITSCSRHDKDRIPVARVTDKYLYLDEVREAIPRETILADSAEATVNYIHKWIRNQLLLEQAKKQLKGQNLDFEKQIEDYRNALIIFAYEQELIKQKLDTTVTDAEIQTYYDTHKEDFLLKNNIVKVIYVKLLKDEKKINRFRQLMQSDDNPLRIELGELCKMHAENYYLDDESWLFFDDMLKEIPIKSYNQEAFLQNNKFIEIQDSLYRYLVYIKAFRIKEGYSPLSFERDRIKSIILHTKKVAILNEMNNSIYENAKKKNRFEVF
ncbi:MAG: hypothetical protein RQ866_07235 [Bacteroidales bacterium]|nr:hypothetical protein [Bacteroidales bacterium]